MLVLQAFYVALFIFQLTSEALAESSECKLVSSSARLDCFPEPDGTQEKCEAKGCCWVPHTADVAGAPQCFFPPDYEAYQVESTTLTDRGYYADLVKGQSTYGFKEFEQVRVEVRQETKSRLRIRYTIPSEPDRWEPPIVLEKPDEQLCQSDFDVELLKSPFGLKIYRHGLSHELLLDSSGQLAPSTILSDQFLQTSFRLGAQKGFGLGEIRTDFPHTLDKWMRAGLWNRDQAPGELINLYGVQNFFMGMDDEGSAFGIFLLNSNAQEVVLTPLPAITYRTIGGIFDFFVFSGPKPLDVIAQYYDLVGRPPIPPYWSLGYHISRYGYTSRQNAEDTVQRNIEKGIPLECQWMDIDYMEANKIWTVDPVNFPDLGNYVKNTIHEKYGMKSVFIIDPGIAINAPDYEPYTYGLELGIFLNDSRTGQPIVGNVWPGDTVFPDSSHPSAEQWWFKSANSFHKKVPFDGMWIDMNEPASFVWGSTTGCDPNNKLDNPPYVPHIVDNSLYSKTVCPSATGYNNVTQYNRHNLYGYDHAQVTYKVMERLFPGTRPFILTRSNFAGSGRYATHWTGDNFATWHDLRRSITQAINFNMYGIPMVGADICGFNEDTTEELCVRWNQLGAFHLFARNHNVRGAIDQDPAVWSSSAMTAMKEAIELRYTILPYMYGLLFRSYLHAEPAVRALAFEFPEDLNAHDVSLQFMLGSCILVTPVVYEGRTSVSGYVPAGEWVDISSAVRVTSRGERKSFKAPLDTIPVHIRGGCIIPTQAKPTITSLARAEGLSLIVVLSTPDSGNPTPEESSTAKGELFWDDGESFPLDYLHAKLEVANRKLTITPTWLRSRSRQAYNPALRFVTIHGIARKPSSVQLNKKSLEYEFKKSLQTLRINCGNGTIIKEPIEISWLF